jgi:Tic22-like family
MTNLLHWFRPTFNIKTIQDPIPELINKISSGEDVKIKIETNNDNIVINNNKKKDIVNISYDSDNKTFNAPKLEKIFHLMSNRRSPNFPTKGQKYIISKLRTIPVYTVVNKKNEIVTASSRDEKNSNSLRWIQEKYNELFFWSHDEGPITINLFFMNKEDASSYMHEICKKEPKEAENLGLKVKSVGLDVFYKLNRTSLPKIQSRLIADLKEIESIITKYSFNSDCTMHPKQKYSTYWFQGNPIYTIKLKKYLNHKTLLNYSLPNSSDRKFIFFNKEDAIKAWNILLSKQENTFARNEPNLEIYNLESLLLDIENDTENFIDVMFVPPYNSYLEVKYEQNQKLTVKTNTFEEYVFKTKLNVKNLQRFYKGLIWLFTSDTLPSEENSW